MPIDSKLIFTGPPSGGRLVFGEAEGSTAPPANLSADADFGPDDLATTGQLLWDANVSRGERHVATMHWEDGDRAGARAQQVWQDAQRLTAQATSRWQDASAIGARAALLWEESQKLSARAAMRWQDGVAQRHQAAQRWQEGLRMRHLAAQRWQDGVAMRHTTRNDWQETIRLRHLAALRWQDGTAMRREHQHSSGPGIPVRVLAATRWQDAMRPPAGLSQPLVPIVPSVDPCYDPATLGRLEFSDAWVQGDGKLVFVCIRSDEPTPPGQIIVPVRSVYMVINDSTLRRLDDSTVIPTSGATLSLDTDSWTWGFTANIPGYALSSVQRVSPGVPVEVDLEINGENFYVQIESVTRSRAFNSDSLRISGRGIGAILDSPYALSVSRSHVFDRTAQQLALEALTVGGVSIGWDLEWGLTDWLVPAGVYNHYGTAISAISAIAGAAGGYVQPHPTLQRLRVLPKFPTAPWLWGSVTPDIILPADPVSIEGTEWVDRAAYNRVFVSGIQSGINGDVSIAGSGGLYVAPPVTDQLITAEEVARQRGVATLGTGGRWVNRDLKLPVLDETGIILPGKFVRYNDGEIEQLGIVRSVNVQVGIPEIWQTIGIESYVA